ncbi:4-diphosphocytidyl-2C-methyl-D-erythritol synthase [Penicillium chermesinum]|uniref:2-C-methyl-D-erythritol 4-phosphate cytidylyltransferase, chloroplastic n=1 Tax=Penicillium chermesinum TaxID=63820 RepID=A0A9W9NZJ7_9EURO|nr:4-diphosphocytidyl-2C-methyl-D-erythritol synthase [Penicillium chermesinum]KAJ5232526.1 4-diphosphocytidyl-2C-methyl-D-erythritol synthase [Penicillium chermesinum]
MANSHSQPTVGIVIPAAGRGTRAGDGCQKAYRRLGGDTVINRTLRLFRSWDQTCAIVIVHHADDNSLLQASVDLDENIYTTIGGAERGASVLAGLRFLAGLKASPSHVFIHDAARPFASVHLLDQVYDSIVKDPSIGVIPGLAVADTLKRTDSHGLITATVPRDGLFRAQTPQAFDLQTILEVHEQAAVSGTSYTDDASLFEEQGLPVRVVAGESDNIKLTYKEDFDQAERFLKSNLLPTPPAPVPDIRVGHGYDTHRLVPGEEITLCGVKIPHKSTLLGHSDADVGLHALTNAFLGSIAADDIGSHFSDTDPRWRGVSSDKFLQHAATLVAEAGGLYRDVMRQSVAAIVGLHPSRVSVKAGTNEKIGFVGREEGIVAFATATVVFPSS